LREIPLGAFLGACHFAAEILSIEIKYLRVQFDAPKHHFSVRHGPRNVKKPSKSDTLDAGSVASVRQLSLPFGEIWGLLKRLKTGGPRMSLTDTMIRSFKPKPTACKVADERRLFRLVTPAGGKLWKLKCRNGWAVRRSWCTSPGTAPQKASSTSVEKTQPLPPTTAGTLA
jgi:hypothetical protein